MPRIGHEIGPSLLPWWLAALIVVTTLHTISALGQSLYWATGSLSHKLVHVGVGQKRRNAVQTSLEMLPA